MPLKFEYDKKKLLKRIILIIVKITINFLLLHFCAEETLENEKKSRKYKFLIIF